MDKSGSKANNILTKQVHFMLQIPDICKFYLNVVIWHINMKRVKQSKINDQLTLLILIVGIQFLFLIPQQIQAQSELSFDIFSQENGLPNNQIQCIYQDSKGWMWIGTSQGLSRFDGYHFLNYLPRQNDSSSLFGNLVRVIKEDSRGNLLIGTETGGLNIFNREKEIFTQPFKNIEQLKNKEISVNTIEEDKNGNIWIGTDFNIIVIDSTGETNQIKPLLNDTTIEFEGNYVRNLRFDTNGKLWIGTNNGVFIYTPESNKMEVFNLPFHDNPNKEIWEIYLDDEGFIWIGTYSAGAFLVNPQTNEIKPILLDPGIDRSETVRSISKGVFGEYWIGTRGGLFVYSKENGVSAYYRHKTRDLRSLSNNSILSIFHDAQGETWIGTRGGLNLLAKSKQVFQNFSALSGDKRYLNSATIYAFWIDDDNNIWIGTEDGGVNIYHPKTKTYEYLMADENQSQSISQNCIKAFLKDDNDNLWIGTFLGGIDVLNLKTKKIIHYHQNIDKPGSLSDNRVYDICKDQNGEIWVATANGVDKVVKETNSFIHYPQLNANDLVTWIETDSKGNIWMGGSDEIIVYNVGNNSIKRYFEHSRGMFENSKNEIWITTLDNGIAHYSAETGPLKYFNEKDGLVNNQALCMLEDNNNNLWISTSNGLSKFNPSLHLFENFTSKDGLSNNQFCYGAAYKTEKGELLFGTISGFNLFNPDDIISTENNVPVVLTDLKILNKSVAINV